MLVRCPGKAGSWLYLLLLILHIVIAIALIAAVVLQSGRSAGLAGAITGGAETVFGRRKKGLDELLSNITRYLGVGYFATALLMSVFF